MLRELHDGFLGWREEQPSLGRRRVVREPLRVGCFVESVAILRQRHAEGREVRRPRMLLNYCAGQGAAGHAVVTFETAAGLSVINPQRPHEVVLAGRARDSARELAEALVGHRLAKARWGPMDEFLATDNIGAASGRGVRGGSVQFNGGPSH